MEEEPQPSTSTSSGTTGSTGAGPTATATGISPNLDSETSTSKAAEPGASTRSRHSSDSEPNSEEKTFECNICLDVAKDAVVSYCGHLFCWPCLHQWLETRPTRQSCPVCKAAISKDKVIPLYGRGGSGEDPRSKVPPRPQATRTEQPESSHRFAWGGNGDGGSSFHMSFGIGAFPFGFFASAYNWGRQGGAAGGLAGANFVDPEQLEQQEFLHKIFLWIAIMFIAWLIYL